jgi:hypothetical protein
MSNQIKGGKRPISQRTSASFVNSDDIFQNTLALDPQLLSVLESKGLSHRFINFKQFIDMGGTHKAHWSPIKRSRLKEMGYDNIDVGSFIAGGDADGYIRRGDLVLAVRPKELNDKHQAYLRQEAGRGKHIQTQHAEELKDFSRRSGLNAKVFEGYDEDSEVQ